MTNKWLIFAGTIEGRKLAEFCSEKGIPAIVCVATEYGEELVDSISGVEIQRGRLDQTQMEELIEKHSPVGVIDATHPYASVVTQNIKASCEAKNTKYYRLVRDNGGDLGVNSEMKVFEDVKSAAEYLETQSGNILLTTGIKELPVFANAITNKDRLFARVLLQEDIFTTIDECGISKKQVLCMQGPFSKAMNKATIEQTGAAFLVTKESGKAGGFMEKVQAAKEMGITCILIARPSEETGLSLEETMKVIAPECETSSGKRTVTFVGIGMGNENQLTLEAEEAFSNADCIIGADRMLEAAKRFNKPVVSMYKATEIADYILAHAEYNSFAISLSGDVGFYSGSKKLIGELKERDSSIEIKQCCGISSPMYLASKLCMSWDDMALCSIHGRNQNIVATVRKEAKTFALVSKDESVRELAKLLVKYGLGETTMHVGVDLSYDTEKITSGKTNEFVDFTMPGLCAVIIENDKYKDAVVTHGIQDEEFLRDTVPMTKEEVRSVAISKLQLKKDSIIYDVGSGSGSVSVECALQATDGWVYAIERKEEAVNLTKANSEKFGVTNITVVPGMAPDNFGDLPAPTHAFIGGSGGNMKEIIDSLRAKNENIRVVITCIALETVAECMELIKGYDTKYEDVAAVSVAKSKILGKYHMMMGQNPVYVITLQF